MLVHTVNDDADGSVSGCAVNFQPISIRPLADKWTRGCIPEFHEASISLYIMLSTALITVLVLDWAENKTRLILRRLFGPESCLVLL